jgi:hypothetical protein
MTTESSESRDDSFAIWDTYTLIEICFRVTPEWEQDNWVVTSRDSRYKEVDRRFVERFTLAELRVFAVEQLEDYGITVHDVNRMKS